jgi:hypothetical protein
MKRLTPLFPLLCGLAGAGVGFIIGLSESHRPAVVVESPKEGVVSEVVITNNKMWFPEPAPPAESLDTIEKQAAVEAANVKLKEVERQLDIAEAALRKKDELMASLQMDLRIAESVRADLSDLTAAGELTPDSLPDTIPASEIRGSVAAEATATARQAWQYPQPINPTDWIQQTLTPPPTGGAGAWDRIRGTR